MDRRPDSWAGSRARPRALKFSPALRSSSMRTAGSSRWTQFRRSFWPPGTPPEAPRNPRSQRSGCRGAPGRFLGGGTGLDPRTLLAAPRSLCLPVRRRRGSPDCAAQLPNVEALRVRRDAPPGELRRSGFGRNFPVRVRGHSPTSHEHGVHAAERQARDVVAAGEVLQREDDVIHGVRERPIDQ